MAKKLNIFVIFYLDDIFIYIKYPSQPHVNAVWWILKQLMKTGLFANLKKCQFCKDKVLFLGYVMFVQEIQIEDKKIKAVKNWPEPKSICNIQVFYRFANLYSCFI